MAEKKEKTPKESIKELLDDAKALKEMAKGLMDELDTDKSGKLEKNEVKALIIGFCKENGVPESEYPKAEDIEESFKKLDTDGSGAVDLDELIPLVKDIV